MAEEVGIKIDEFDWKVSNLRSAVFSINSSIKTNREFEKTNLEPFMGDLETTIDAIKLLERYKQMLNGDTDALDNVGQEMEENDEEIAQKTVPNSVG